MSLITGSILTPSPACSLLPSRVRILHIDRCLAIVWCIELPRFGQDGHIAGYVRAPLPIPESDIVRELNAGTLTQARFNSPGHWAMTDQDYLSAGLSETELAIRRGRLKRRDASWELIKPIVKQHTLEELLRMPTVRPLVQERADACDRSIVTVFRTLHLYWAHGSIPNGLAPMTFRSGAPGRERNPTKPLGRPSARSKLEPATPQCYILAQQDKARIGLAYALTDQGTRVSVAFATMNTQFYSDQSVDADGNERFILRPLYERPTRRQFCYWGKKLSTSQHFRQHNGLPQMPKKRTHNGGSTQELSVTVGQSCQFDATSGDVYLTSLFDRRQKLPPPTRSILIEQRSTAILAPHVGWSHSSARTFLQTLYIGTTNKVRLCGRFGINIGPDDWPGMLCSRVFADNGEARNAESIAAAENLGFGMEFAPSFTGSAKGDVESHHHADHKRLDHQLPGTTHGHQRERGQKHPADFALWNYFEYMREYLLVCIKYNNTEVPGLAPTEMRLTGIRPTRINILKWLLANGQRGDIPFDIAQVRAWALPTVDAVMQYNGIVLIDPDSNHRVSELRFFSDALQGDPRFVNASSTRRSSRIHVKAEQENLCQVWVPSERGLLRIPEVSADRFLLQHGTLADLGSHRESEATRGAKLQQASDQSEADEAQRRESVTRNAKTELQRQMATATTKTSKAEQRRNLRKNAAAEQEAISSQFVKDRPPAAPVPRGTNGPPPTRDDYNAAAAAMADFIRNLSDPQKS